MSPTMPDPGVSTARAGFEALDPCVHCGFCLPACPTYLATGDESDSPRGRILLMRALERGELAADDPGLVQHLDACLGCRGCEPVCPSGVGYGRGLEAARARISAERGLSGQARAVLGMFSQPWRWRFATALARVARATGLARLVAGSGRLGFLAGMVAATRPSRREGGGHPERLPESRGTVALFRGCVMDGLFGHVHEATRRTLEVNGYRVVEVEGQGCCGALHDHAGDQDGARALAMGNVKAFLGRADFVVVNSAGCGALLKDLGHLLGTVDAADVGSRTRDVSELLAAAGPRPGGPLALTVGYDAPCHLQHAQRVHREVLDVLAAIPSLVARELPGSDRCCGSAGIYGVLHPELSRAVLDDKVAAIGAASPVPDLIVTGNPGCLMQIGAGLAAAGLRTKVAHPVELLDWSYRVAGYYDPSPH
ncbi:MAG: (Fe-S)-binding protein [Gemmatimonadetes bacterium]|nr:(Fe-S)-binding protein [Gemmatimonadota bacterium]